MDPLGDIVPAVAAGGMLGLAGIATVERFVPVLPSYTLLVAIGIAAAEGHWSLPAAHLTSTAGGLVGCLGFFMLGWALGERRALAIFGRIAWLFGASRARVDVWVDAFRHRQRVLAFGAQLVPTVRLFAPVIGGLLHADPRVFLLGTGAGLALWNALFIGVGYAAARVTGNANVSAVAVGTLAALLAAEAVVTAAWRFRSVR